MGNLKSVKEDTFEQEVLNASGLTVVKFWAEWCGPCRQYAPVVEAVAEETPYNFVEVNIDEEPAIAQEYGVASIPTTLIFSDGVPMGSIVGARNKKDLTKALKRAEKGAKKFEKNRSNS